MLQSKAIRISSKISFGPVDVDVIFVVAVVCSCNLSAVVFGLSHC